jgi:hypothetical protein
MQASPAEMSHAVYRRAIPEELVEYRCTSHMLTLLAALDGSANLTAVAKQVGLPMKSVLSAASSLLELQLIQMADGAARYLDQAFMAYLKTELSTAVGPIAEILIEDGIKDLGHSIEAFPVYKAAELVELLAQDIQKEDRRIDFQQKMVARFKQG